MKIHGLEMPINRLREGAMPTLIAASFYKNIYEHNRVSLATSWPALRKRLAWFKAHRSVQDKLRLPCWSPTQSLPEGDRSALGVTCLVLDIDNGIEMNDALERCSPFTVALHTSWSHTSGHHRFRVVLPLARPIDARDWPGAWRRAVKLLDLPADSACSNATRRYLLPALPGPQAETHAEFRDTGVALDLFDLAQEAAAAAPRPLPPRRNVVVPFHRHGAAVQQRLAKDPGARLRLAEALGARLQGQGDNERATGVRCPSCGRASVWFLISPHVATRARCNHVNSCGWSSPLTELQRAAA
ncbi:MAG: hypothetical protein EA397_16995 [Deltaproteobacteria bacterium]|nr:MAG: hypothetical protein EA397_16995 [Deltaproteobacteria bacterium]